MKIKDEVQKILEMSSSSYESKKKASESIDQILNLRSHLIETQLEIARKSIQREVDRRTWIGFSSQDFQTTYHEFKEILDFLKPSSGQTIVDIGSAYGRMAIVQTIFYPDSKFVGYEIVKSRHEEAERINRQWGYQKSEFYNLDVTDSQVEIIPAEFYFIYDFSNRRDLDLVLQKLKVIAQKSEIRLIGRGRGISHWIFELAPWLTEVKEPIFQNTWTVYSS